MSRSTAAIAAPPSPRGGAPHVGVVGGGLAGLAAAALLARRGARVTLFEGSELGGRARSEVRDGVTLNLGPHALYRSGTARRVLHELGVPTPGGSPPQRSLGLVDGRLVPLPFEPLSLLTTSWLRGTERWSMARFFAQAATQDPERLRGRSTSAWLADWPDRIARAAGAAIRACTYCADLDRLDAAAAAWQLRAVLRRVDYLDGGWQPLVDGLRRVVDEHGVDVRRHTPARAVTRDRVTTDVGAVEVDGVVLCVAPRIAAELTDSPALARVAAAATPVRAACLDVVMRGTVDAAHRFALGVDRPLYLSVHSDVARLAPADRTVIHAAVYGADGEPAALRSELEDGLDVLVEGWRERVVRTRFLPRLLVAHDLPTADRQGRLAPPSVPDRPGIWVAGDWVETGELLADAALGSARIAAEGVLQDLRAVERA